MEVAKALIASFSFLDFKQNAERALIFHSSAFKRCSINISVGICSSFIILPSESLYKILVSLNLFSNI
ncbi:hypothetical protein ES708_34570 [subsurface metagenome]